MVCVLIKRKAPEVSDELLDTLVDRFHAAIVEVFKVKPEDVEIDTKEISHFARNCYPITVEIDSGPGKENWRIEECRPLLEKINAQVAEYVPAEFRMKGKSNMWLRIYAKGASMPIGCPELAH